MLASVLDDVVSNAFLDSSDEDIFVIEAAPESIALNLRYSIWGGASIWHVG